MIGFRQACCLGPDPFAHLANLGLISSLTSLADELLRHLARPLASS